MIRLSLNEVQKILRLASTRGMISPTAGPSLGTVADAFGLQPWQVEKLLNEVREQEAEAPHWRKLTAIGAAVAVLVVLGLVFSALRPSPSPTASASNSVAPSALTPGGGPSPLPGYSAASFAPPGRIDSSQSGAADTLSLQRHHGRAPVAADGAEQAVLPTNRFAKTDASDLNNARSKAERTGYGAEDTARRPGNGLNAAAPSGR